MNNPLVSIAIPAYKATFLRQAIESALKQTYHNVEVIVVDDNSPQNLQEIISTFNDPRLKYYKNKKNIGKNNPVYNWNKCISYAQGEYFSLLCDDDLYEPTFIEEMLSLALRFPDTNVFRTRADVIDKKGNVVDWYPCSPEWEDVDDYIWHVNRRYRKQTISEFMYKTEHIRKLKGYLSLPLAWYADYISVYNFALKGGIASSSKILMHFRQSGQNISSQDKKNTLKKLHAIKQYIDWTTAFITENHLTKSSAQIKYLRNSLKIEQEWILKKASKINIVKALAHRHSLMIHFSSIKKSLL